jgi:multiple sugar transport system permease protein
MQKVPPSGLGPLGKREERLAWGMLLPTILSVSLIIILPLCAIFWISFKPISLADLRPPTVLVKEQLKGQINAAGDAAKIRYRIRNSSQSKPLTDVTISDIIPESFDIQSTDERCSVDETNAIYCIIGVLEGGQREVIEAEVLINDSFFGSEKQYKITQPSTSSVGDNILTNSKLTFENFQKIFDSEEFITVILTTLFYTVFGTVGAVVVGLFAALLLNINFRGKGLVRGLYLFPYVAPVIAVAFSWINLFDPFSGSINSLLLQMDVLDSPSIFLVSDPML